LRDFVAVAAAGSFTRAAEKLHVAQPALSQQIKRLEEEFGVRVFEREARGISITDEGRQLLESATEALRRYDALLDLAADLRRGARGRLRVGFIAQGPGELLPEILRAFKRSHPNVEVSLHQFGFEDCFVGVTRELSDVGFSHGMLDEDDRIASQSLEEPIVVVMASDHHLATRKRLTIDEIIDEPLFTDMHSPGRWRDYWDAIPHRKGAQPAIAGRFASHDEWLEAVRLGGGIGLCPESTPTYYPRSGVAFVPLEGMAPAVHSIVWCKDRASTLVSDFVSTALSLVSVRG
jgi:DNA-binding transcriptional LysR family regulator